ncbi:MAG: hypothetical protein J6Z34_01465 [Clostridia bacterium]|nr:hypothetical protein [Clostridia bacterium]
MKRSLIKILVVAVAFGIALSIATGSTFAWFSLNTSVTVTGMKVSTRVASTIYVADDTLDGNSIKSNANFGSSVSRGITALLLPVSTVNGTAFFYTTDAKADGDKESAPEVKPYVAYSPTNTTSFNERYNAAGAVGYVDYAVQLKVVNADTDGSNAANNIKITDLTLNYESDDIGAEAALSFRVAVFVKDITSASAADIPGVGDLTGIYAHVNAANHKDVGGNNYAVSEAGAAPTRLLENYNAAAGQLVEVPDNKTSVYKVVLRLYIEGEDTACTNETFLRLTDGWSLSVRFDLDPAGGVIDSLSITVG